MKILNESGGMVVLSWVEFEIILEWLPKNLLIRMFAEDILTQREWKKLDRRQIISQIFLNTEEQIEEYDQNILRMRRQGKKK